MNLKKSVLSVFATAALCMSVLVPAVSANDSQSAGATVNENGDFTYQMGFSSMAFSGAGVTTSESMIVQSTRGSVGFNDTHSHNPTGWSLSISADNFETADGDYYISNEYFRVWERSKAGCVLEATNPPVGNNGYQTITDGYLPMGPGSPDVAKGVPLSGEPTVVSGSDGRGCGASSVGLYYQLTVPAGTYTGNGTAVYTTNITLTNTMEVGDPQ